MGHKMKPHYIYEMEFPDGMMYVGCTFDVAQRMKQHHYSPCKSLKKHMKKTGFDISDVTVRVVRKVMYKSIGLRIEKGKIRRYHKQGKCLNYYKGKNKDILFDIEVDGEIKQLLADETFIKKS